jgi:hypothetical protein
MQLAFLSLQSVKFLLAFASTIIPGLIFFKMHDQDFYSFLDMYMFQNGVSVDV